MSLVVGTNTSAQFAQDALRANQNKIATAMQRLSTGLRINSARDDAAGLAISQSMTAQIRGLNQAVRNINDGVNMLQTAEGGLGSITDMLQRMRELAVQSANGTYSNTQRAYLQKEAAALQEQISKVVDTTTWNEKKLLDGSFTGQKIQVGAASGATMDLTIPSAVSLRSNQAIEWTKSINTSGITVGNAVTVGNDGAIYVAGTVSGNIDGVSTQSEDAFVTKFTSDGIKEWTQLIGSSNVEYGESLAIGHDGSIYVTGITDSPSLAGQTNNSEWRDAFITKLNPNGTKDWTKLLGSNAAHGPNIYEKSANITIGLDGSLYVSGHTNHPITAEPDAYITKLSPSGAQIWTQLIGSSGTDFSSGISASIDGSVYVVGFTNSSSLDGQVNSNNLSTVFLTKLNSNGTKAWTKLEINNDISSNNFSIAIGSNSLIYISGTQQNGDIATPFISKYNQYGSKDWTSIMNTSNGVALGTGLTTTPDGSIYVTGYAEGTVDGQPVSGDAFLSKYNIDGSKDWTHFLGLSAGSYAQNICSGQNGEIYITGISADTAGFLTKLTAPSFSTDISTQAGASSAIGVIDSTLDTVNSTRSTIGSYTNRLTYAGDNATNISTNLSASRSAIQDTDYAEESANLSKSQIIQQAATAMLAQANQQPQSVLALLKNL